MQTCNYSYPKTQIKRLIATMDAENVSIHIEVARTPARSAERYPVSN
jgi:cob(I)alamin adenosyltransferase